MIPNEILENALKTIDGKKVFLTGGTGFFGKSFLDLLRQNSGHHQFSVTILTRNSQTFLKKYPEFKLPFLKFSEGDIKDFKFPNEKFDTILHFATPADAKMNVEQPQLMFDTIVSGMKHILDFTVQCQAKDFLFASSGAVYGPQPTSLERIPEDFDDVNTSHVSAYAEGKRISEQMGRNHSRNHGFQFKIARCFAFAGVHLDRNGSYAIGNFMKNALEGKPIEIKGDGRPLRSYLYCDDLVVWLLIILNQGRNCEAYNVGSDQSIGIYELAQIVKRIFRSSVTISRAQSPSLGDPAPRYVPSIKKAQEELGLQVWTSLEKSLEIIRDQLT